MLSNNQIQPENRHLDLVQLAKLGTYSLIAAKANVTYQTVSKWAEGGDMHHLSKAAIEQAVLDYALTLRGLIDRVTAPAEVYN